MILNSFEDLIKNIEEIKFFKICFVIDILEVSPLASLFFCFE